MVFTIPASISSAIAAPMLCAGLTVDSPLVRNSVGANTRIGIIGIGSLGHFAIMFASALGATVTAISHLASKAADVTSMGATSFICISNENWWVGEERRFDFILCTSFVKGYPIKQYISLFDVGRNMLYVGIPEGDLPSLKPGLMVKNDSAWRGSNTGSRKEVLELLELVAREGIQIGVEVIPMERCVDTITKLEAGEARYRLVLQV